MSDEVSLFALMDSHLSNTKLDDRNHTTCSTSGIMLPTPPGPTLVIPNYFPGNSPMKDFITEQISNTLKAKEKRKQEEEQRKIEEEMKNLKIREKQQLGTLDDEEYVIDLTAAIIQQPKSKQSKTQSIVPDQTSTKSQRPKAVQGRLFSVLPMRFDKETCLYKLWNPYFPCTTDISYILKQKKKRVKCSNFGKVFCSIMQHPTHIAIPYKIDKFDSNLERFHFKTKSPGDIFRETLDLQWKPKMSTRWTVNILDYIN